MESPGNDLKERRNHNLSLFRREIMKRLIMSNRVDNIDSGFPRYLFRGHSRSG